MALSCSSTYQSKHQRTVIRKFEKPKYRRSDCTKHLNSKEVKGGNK